MSDVAWDKIFISTQGRRTKIGQGEELFGLRLVGNVFVYIHCLMFIYVAGR